MQNQEWTFFLGANSKHGFVSLFEDAVAEDFSRETYMIKGGPGCGKSTCMRRILSAVAGGKEPRELIYCSSDPDSLDGFILPNAGLAVIDATLPHALEPKFPGASGDYITFPPLLGRHDLQENFPALVTLSAASKQHYAQAFRLIAASALVRDHIQEAVSPLFDFDRLKKRAAGIILREMPRRSGTGVLKKRFLDGITPKGLLRYYATADAMASRVYDLYDTYGFAHLLLAPLCEAALSRGYDVYACYSPRTPEVLLHLIIPQLSLAFVSSSPDCAYVGAPYRRIRVDACADFSECRGVKGKCKLLRRVESSLMEDAVSELAAAHGLHDKIEEIYLPHIDRQALDALSDSWANRLASERA